MAENSGIEWTHHTFNPWIGCTKVSPACGTAKALHVSVAIGYNNHMHAKCKECGEGFME